MTDIEKNVNEEEFEEVPVFTLTDEESGESQDFELLANAQVHKTTMIHPEDASVLRKLKIDATADPVYNAKKLYVK